MKSGPYFLPPHQLDGYFFTVPPEVLHYCVLISFSLSSSRYFFSPSKVSCQADLKSPPAVRCKIFSSKNLSLLYIRLFHDNCGVLLGAPCGVAAFISTWETSLSEKWTRPMIRPHSSLPAAAAPPALHVTKRRSKAARAASLTTPKTHRRKFARFRLISTGVGWGVRPLLDLGESTKKSSPAATYFRLTLSLSLLCWTCFALSVSRSFPSTPLRPSRHDLVTSLQPTRNVCETSYLFWVI